VVEQSAETPRVIVAIASACDGLSRLLWRSVPDRLGRENTILLTFGVEPHRSFW